MLTTGYADTEALCARLQDVGSLVEHKRGERLARILERVGGDSVVVTPAAPPPFPNLPRSAC